MRVVTIDLENDALLGVAEVSEVLGITQGKVTELLKRDPEFPPPLARLRMGTLWLASSFRGYRLPGERWKRGDPPVLRPRDPK